MVWPAKSDTPSDAGSADKCLVVPGAAAGRADGRGTTGPPVDLEEQAVRRLGLVAGAVVAVSVLEALLSHLWPWLTRPGYPGEKEKWDLVGNLLVVTVSVLTLAATRWRRLPNLTRLRVGVAYLVTIAYLVSLTDHADHFWAGGHRHHGIPWVTALILVFPVLVPMPPLRALALGLVMAATSPLAMWTHVLLLGYEPPQSAPLLDAFPFLFAFVAAFSAAVVHQLGREVGRARRLGAYTLESRLGSGGMGEVWIASHRLLARAAAVKLIRPPRSGLDSRTLLERFEREAQATAALKSPYTVHVYDFGTSDDGRLFYAMELLEGVDLDTLVTRHGAQPAERVVHWLRQACHSLGEAHEAGLVHRDLKPANLYACRYGRDYDFIKVLDFGLVSLKPSIDSAQSTLTANGQMLGTPAYMPPEMATGSSPVDARSDLYALGCVAYYLLTAEDPFPGGSVMEVVLGHVTQAPRPPSQVTAQPIPAELDEIVLACLAKSPAERPESADELLARLERCPVASPWTPERARRWWEAHTPPFPEVASSPPRG